jgi:hypothetical protein
MACEPELRSISARLTAPSAATSTRITTVLAVLRAAGRWPARSASSIFVMKAESQSRTAGETLSREAPGPASSSRPSTAPQACIRRVAINRRWRLPKQVSRRLGCRALPSRLQPPDVRQAQCPPRTPQGAPARSHSRVWTRSAPEGDDGGQSEGRGRSCGQVCRSRWRYVGSPSGG